LIRRLVTGQKIAVIPARGGSKRVPKKNYRNFCGQPMLSWCVSAALASEMFDHVIVSTDSDEITKLAQKYGASVPFKRPANLSGDFVSTRPVVNHAIEKASELFGEISFVCCIYPTSPFLAPSTIRASGEALINKSLDFVFSCASYRYPIQRALRINEAKTVEMLWPENRSKRSQDLEETFHDAGQFYWGRAEAFLRNQHTFGANSLPWILPAHLVHDIDTQEDWDRAELIFKTLKAADDCFPLFC
jgi:pseudaminic acid cytidylyltransferase